MESIFTGLVILLGVSSISMAVLYLMYRTEKKERYPVHSDITYDHIEEDIIKVAQRKKRKAANAKRKSVKKPS
jgi:hypothetical protein